MGIYYTLLFLALGAVLVPLAAALVILLMWGIVSGVMCLTALYRQRRGR